MAILKENYFEVTMYDILVVKVFETMDGLSKEFEGLCL